MYIDSSTPSTESWFHIIWSRCYFISSKKTKINLYRCSLNVRFDYSDIFGFLCIIVAMKKMIRTYNITHIDPRMWFIRNRINWSVYSYVSYELFILSLRVVVEKIISWSDPCNIDNVLWVLVQLMCSYTCSIYAFDRKSFIVQNKNRNNQQCLT